MKQVQKGCVWQFHVSWSNIWSLFIRSMISIYILKIEFLRVWTRSNRFICIRQKKKGRCTVIAVYEMEDTEILPDNGRYFFIDLGFHNLITCYDNKGKSFILGEKYLSICRRYDREIARIQVQVGDHSEWKGICYPKLSRHLLKLYEKKKNSIRDYLHKLTCHIVEYCKKEEIYTVVIGDITSIRKKKDRGHKTNQKLHGLPYAQIYHMLDYKLSMYGIKLVKQLEAYTSQCSPLSAENMQ